MEKDELYSYVHIAYNLVQKEKSNGNIKQTMYPDSEIIVENKECMTGDNLAVAIGVSSRTIRMI